MTRENVALMDHYVLGLLATKCYLNHALNDLDSMLVEMDLTESRTQKSITSKLLETAQTYSLLTLRAESHVLSSSSNGQYHRIFYSNHLFHFHLPANFASQCLPVLVCEPELVFVRVG